MKLLFICVIFVALRKCVDCSVIIHSNNENSLRSVSHQQEADVTAGGVESVALASHRRHIRSSGVLDVAGTNVMVSSLVDADVAVPDPLEHFSEIGSTLTSKHKRCRPSADGPNRILGLQPKALPTPLLRRDTVDILRKQRCEACLNSTKCTKYGKCDLCSNHCTKKSSKDTPSISNIEEREAIDTGIETANERHKNAADPTLVAMANRQMFQDDPNAGLSEVDDRYYTVGSFGPGPTQSLLARLLQVSNKDSLERLIVLAKTKAKKSGSGLQHPVVIDTAHVFTLNDGEPTEVGLELHPVNEKDMDISKLTTHLNKELDTAIEHKKKLVGDSHLTAKEIDKIIDHAIYKNDQKVIENAAVSDIVGSIAEDSTPDNKTEEDVLGCSDEKGSSEEMILVEPINYGSYKNVEKQTEKTIDEESVGNYREVDEDKERSHKKKSKKGGNGGNGGYYRNNEDNVDMDTIPHEEQAHDTDKVAVNDNIDKTFNRELIKNIGTHNNNDVTDTDKQIEISELENTSDTEHYENDQERSHKKKKKKGKKGGSYGGYYRNNENDETDLLGANLENTDKQSSDSMQVTHLEQSNEKTPLESDSHIADSKTEITEDYELETGNNERSHKKKKKGKKDKGGYGGYYRNNEEELDEDDVVKANLDELSKSSNVNQSELTDEIDVQGKHMSENESTEVENTDSERSHKKKKKGKKGHGGSGYYRTSDDDKSAELVEEMDTKARSNYEQNYAAPESSQQYSSNQPKQQYASQQPQNPQQYAPVEQYQSSVASHSEQYQPQQNYAQHPEHSPALPNSYDDNSSYEGYGDYNNGNTDYQDSGEYQPDENNYGPEEEYMPVEYQSPVEQHEYTQQEGPHHPEQYQQYQSNNNQEHYQPTQQKYEPSNHQATPNQYPQVNQQQYGSENQPMHTQNQPQYSTPNHPIYPGHHQEMYQPQHQQMYPPQKQQTYEAPNPHNPTGYEVPSEHPPSYYHPAPPVEQGTYVPKKTQYNEPPKLVQPAVQSTAQGTAPQYINQEYSNIEQPEEEPHYEDKPYDESSEEEQPGSYLQDIIVPQANYPNNEYDILGNTKSESDNNKDKIDVAETTNTPPSNNGIVDEFTKIIRNDLTNGANMENMTSEELNRRISKLIQESLNAKNDAEKLQASNLDSKLNNLDDAINKDVIVNLENMKEFRTRFRDMDGIDGTENNDDIADIMKTPLGAKLDNDKGTWIARKTNINKPPYNSKHIDGPLEHPIIGSHHMLPTEENNVPFIDPAVLDVKSIVKELSTPSDEHRIEDHTIGCSKEESEEMIYVIPKHYGGYYRENENPENRAENNEAQKKLDDEIPVGSVQQQNVEEHIEGTTEDTLGCKKDKDSEEMIYVKPVNQYGGYRESDTPKRLLKNLPTLDEILHPLKAKHAKAEKSSSINIEKSSETTDAPQHTLILPELIKELKEIQGHHNNPTKSLKHAKQSQQSEVNDASTHAPEVNVIPQPGVHHQPQQHEQFNQFPQNSNNNEFRPNNQFVPQQQLFENQEFMQPMINPSQMEARFPMNNFRTNANSNLQNMQIFQQSRQQPSFPINQGIVGAPPPPMQDPRMMTNFNIEQEMNNHFGSMVPANRPLNLHHRDVSEQTQMFFVGDGIKLPIHVNKQSDGTMHLSIDLTKMCNCKNTTCNHTVNSLANLVPTLEKLNHGTVELEVNEDSFNSALNHLNNLSEEKEEGEIIPVVTRDKSKRSPAAKHYQEEIKQSSGELVPVFDNTVNSEEFDDITPIKKYYSGDLANDLFNLKDNIKKYYDNEDKFKEIMSDQPKDSGFLDDFIHKRVELLTNVLSWMKSIAIDEARNPNK